VVAVTFVSGNFRRRLIGLYLSPSSVDDDTWAALHLACEDAANLIWLIHDFNVDLHSSGDSCLNFALNENSDACCAEIKALAASRGCVSFALTKLECWQTGFGHGNTTALLVAESCWYAAFVIIFWFPIWTLCLHLRR
jgi:hypothetical protein